MYINHRHYILLLLASGAIIFSGVGYALLYRTVRSQSIRVHEATRETAIVDEKKQQEEDAAIVYEKTTEERARLGSLVVSQEKIVDFIKSVEKIGDNVNVQVELSAIANEPTLDTLGYFKGHIEAHGSWANIMRTLVLLEHMPYALSLNSVRLAQSSDPVSKTLATKVWNLSLDLRLLSVK